MSSPRPSSAESGETVPDALITVLSAWRRLIGLQASMRCFGWAMAAASLPIAGAMVLDLAGDPLPWARVGLAGAGLVVLLVAGVAALRRRFLRVPLPRLARSLELRASLAGEPLSGALAMAGAPPPGISRWMIGRSLALAALAADGLDLRRLSPWRTAMPGMIAGATVIVILAISSTAHPAIRAAAARALLPWRELPEPGAELLIAEPGDVWLAPGDSLAIAVRAPTAMQAELSWSDGVSELRDMHRDGAMCRLDTGPVQRELRWRVRGPGLASAWHQARLVAVPRIATVSLIVEPPAYSGLPDERLQGGDASVIAGSSVAFEVVLDGPVAASAALIAGEQVLPMSLLRSPYGGQIGTARLRVAADLEWHLRLIVAGGSGGIAIDPPQRWRLHSIADVAPEVAASADAVTVAPGRAVRIAVAGSDDVGLAAMWLEAGMAKSPVRIALPVPSGARRAEATAALVPADLGAMPGDRLLLVPIARDRAGAETRGIAIEILVTQQAHADRHDLAGRLADLAKHAAEAASAARETERSWRAAARAWRAEDPTAGASGLRAAATRARGLAAAVTLVSDGAEAAGALAGAPSNLDRIATLALTTAGAATALAARSAATEAGNAEARGGAVAAAEGLVAATAELAYSTLLAFTCAETAAAAADLEAARDALSGAAVVLTAEQAWSLPRWKPGLAGRFWRGVIPEGDAPIATANEVPTVADRDVPGIGPDDWCARWQGEVQVPVAGRWTFRCTADDGVRLRIAGQDLLPDAAWQRQGATPFDGVIELAAGWHAIDLAYFQGGGGSVLSFSAGTDRQAPLTLERLRHREALAANTLRTMAALPVGAAEAAAIRARAAGATLTSAVTSAQQAIERLTTLRRVPGLDAPLDRLAALPIQDAFSAWTETAAVEAVAVRAAEAAEVVGELARFLRERCRADLRRGGDDDSGPAERLRAAAAKPGKQRAVIDELAIERKRLITIAGDQLNDPAYRAAALAAAWSLDDMTIAFAGVESGPARAALAAATPALALVARHVRAAEASASAAQQGPAAGSLVAELALSPGWPPSLLRAARDRLRNTANLLRHDSVENSAKQVAAETAWIAECEIQRPGLPHDGTLDSAAALLRDQVVEPTVDGLVEVAELFDRAERRGPESGPDATTLGAARAARRSNAAQTLAETAAALAAGAAALTDAGQGDSAARAAALAELGRTVAASPDRAVASGLADALQSSVAGPLAAAVAEGRIEPGSAAARVGRLAAQTAAAARELASVDILVEAPAGEVLDDWARASDAAAAAAAASSAAIDFPEEHRAAIRAYLRRIGDGR